MSRTKFLIGDIDWRLISLYLFLLIAGWLNIYSSEYNDNQSQIINMSLSHGKQLIWIAISLGLGLFILLLDSRVFHTLSYLGYVVGILLLLATIIVGTVVNGAKGWLVIGGFQLQTGEIAKVTTALALSKWMSNYGFSMAVNKARLQTFVIAFLPAIIVMLQNDLGSALVFFSLIFPMYRMGLPAWFLIIPMILGILSVATLMFGGNIILIILAILAGLIVVYSLYQRIYKLAIVVVLFFGLASAFTLTVNYAYTKVLKDYQKDRIEILLGKKSDPMGAGYNIHQSLIAIGSGGFAGKGYLKGTQTKYDFVPEQSTDFIFCTIGEEFGFLGSLTVVGAYLLLLIRILSIAERQKFMFATCYAYSVASILFIHFTINIAMTLGLFPVVGIPLPFISYGGSSLIGFTLLLFILIKLDAGNREF